MMLTSGGGRAATTTLMKESIMAVVVTALAEKIAAAKRWTGLDWDSNLADLAAALEAGNRRKASAILEDGVGGWIDDDGSYDSQEFWRRVRSLRQYGPEQDGLPEDLADLTEAVRALADEECKSVEADARSAAKHGDAALEAVKAGCWDDAEEEIEAACRLERGYGDDPSWGPVRTLISAMRDAAESESAA